MLYRPSPATTHPPLFNIPTVYCFHQVKSADVIDIYMIFHTVFMMFVDFKNWSIRLYWDNIKVHLHIWFSPHNRNKMSTQPNTSSAFCYSISIRSSSISFTQFQWKAWFRLQWRFALLTQFSTFTIAGSLFGLRVSQLGIQVLNLEWSEWSFYKFALFLRHQKENPGIDFTM